MIKLTDTKGNEVLIDPSKITSIKRIEATPTSNPGSLYELPGTDAYTEVRMSGNPNEIKVTESPDEIQALLKADS